MYNSYVSLGFVFNELQRLITKVNPVLKQILDVKQERYLPVLLF